MSGMAARGLEGLGGFYTFDGRSSVLRFATVAILCWAVLLACGRTSWKLGIPFNALVGAIAGAALAKLVVEIVRRLRDAGHSRRLVVRVTVGAALAVAVVGLSAFEGDKWAELPANILLYLVPAIAAVALLWPGKPTLGDAQVRSRGRAIPFAAACVLGGAAVAGWLAWLENGMAENAREMDEWSHAHRSDGAVR